MSSLVQRELLISMLEAKQDLAEGESYLELRRKYMDEIIISLSEYLFTENARITRYKNNFKKAIATYFLQAYEKGFFAGGSNPKNMTDEDRAWLAAKERAEFAYVDVVFGSAKSLKSDEDIDGQELLDWVEDRANGYAETLDGVYNEGKLRGGMDKGLTFTGDDGQESCRTCQKWKGKRHRASFWIKRGLVPGQPGNVNFECRGYNCQHLLVDDDGNIYTIS